jgi:hypothetical protein
MFDSVPAQNVDDQSADDRVQFTSTQLDRFTAVLKRMALPYKIGGGGASVNSDVSKAVNTATGAISTVDDLARFIVSLDSGDFLHRENDDVDVERARGNADGPRLVCPELQWPAGLLAVRQHAGCVFVLDRQGCRRADSP